MKLWHKQIRYWRYSTNQSRVGVGQASSSTSKLMINHLLMSYQNRIDWSNEIKVLQHWTILNRSHHFKKFMKLKMFLRRAAQLKETHRPMDWVSQEATSVKNVYKSRGAEMQASISSLTPCFQNNKRRKIYQVRDCSSRITQGSKSYLISYYGKESPNKPWLRKHLGLNFSTISLALRNLINCCNRIKWINRGIFVLC